MTKLLRGFLTDRSGTTSIEYGLIGTLVAVAVIAGAASVGTTINSTFSYVSNYARGDGTLGQ